MHILKVTLGAVAAVTLGGSAFAADLAYKAPPVAPPAPVYNWTGFYLGLNGGWGWANSDVTATTFQTAGTTPNPVIPNHIFSQSPSGAVFGGHLGYNWQVGPNWLVGFEGDFDGTNINKSTALIALDPLLGGVGGANTATDGLMVHSEIQWLASLRGRVGWTAGPDLFYFTGGAAWEQVNTNVLLSADTITAVFSTSSAASLTTTKSGWVAGLGWERLIAQNWIVRAEWLHYGFDGGGTINVPLTCGALGATATCGQNITNNNNRVDVVRVGLSYKFF
jgi:outer membrane immunogenic protein